MALGLVQPRPGDFFLKTSNLEQTSSPRHARRQRTVSITKLNDEFIVMPSVQLSIDVVLDTPVLIVPRSSSSPQVLVAHLGRISLSNCVENCDKDVPDIVNSFDDFLTREQAGESEENIFEVDDMDETIKGDDDDAPFADIYSIDIRNMNLFSLDTSSRKGFRLSALPRAEEFYSCQEDAVTIIHDTTIRLEINKKRDAEIFNLESSAGSFVSFGEMNEDKSNQLLISGTIVNPLRLSLKRPQYEQLIDTLENAFSIPSDLQKPHASEKIKVNLTSSESEEETDKFTLGETSVRRKILFERQQQKDSEMLPKILFSLPVFIIQLNNSENSPVVEICFRDFNVNYEKVNLYETSLQVALRSVIMEDLLQPLDSKHRIMVTSASDNCQRPSQAPFLSNSCPDLTAYGLGMNLLSTSLPDYLEQNVGFKSFMNRRPSSVKQKALNVTAASNYLSPCYPGTPPPSPQLRSREDNLVIYSSLIVDPSCPQFESKYKSKRTKSSIDFNSLNLNISVESWFVLLNFFGLLSDEEPSSTKTANVSTQTENEQAFQGITELDISIKSLTLVLVKPEYELARANVSYARFIVTKHEVGKTTEGSLGSISVTDLSSHGCIYREKFMTSGNEALNFTYIRDCPKPAFGKRSLKKDAQLNIKMSSVRYVHTKRYI